MRTIVAAFLLVIIMILTASWAVANTPRAAAAPPGDNLAPRVTALESQVAVLDARLDALEAAHASPTPTPTPSPSGAAPLFLDNFTTWDASRYFVYPNTWRDTSGNGHYDPAIISSDGSKLRINLHTAGGFPHVAALCPLPTGSLSARGDLAGMRVEFRIRADRMLGYKGVPLLWPMSGIWPRDGEINWPESNFDQRPSAFMHRQDATSSSDQDFYPAPTGTSWQDWHTYVIHWSPGAFAEFFIDGVSIGRSTSRVPNTPMHLVMQFETNLSGTLPDPAVNGFVEIDYLRVDAP